MEHDARGMKRHASIATPPAPCARRDFADTAKQACPYDCGADIVNRYRAVKETVFSEATATLIVLRPAIANVTVHEVQQLLDSRMPVQNRLGSGVGEQLQHGWFLGPPNDSKR